MNCRHCGRGVDQGSGVEDPQLTFDGKPGEVHEACERADALERALARIAELEVESQVKGKMLAERGVNGSTVRARVWKAKATLRATPAATRESRKPAPSVALRSVNATREATLPATSSVAHIGNASERAGVELQARSNNDKTATREARADDLPRVEFKKLAETWRGIARRVTGREHPRLKGREQGAVKAAGRTFGVDGAIEKMHELAAMYRQNPRQFKAGFSLLTFELLFLPQPEKKRAAWRGAAPPSRAQREQAAADRDRELREREAAASRRSGGADDLATMLAAIRAKVAS